MKNPDLPFQRGHSRRVLAALASAVMIATLASTATASAAGHPAVAQHRLGCHASVTNTHPQQHTRVGVLVVTRTHARVKVVAHFKTLRASKYGRIKIDGRRTYWYRVGRAIIGIRVKVHVRVRKDGQTARCSTWFTPNDH